MGAEWLLSQAELLSLRLPVASLFPVNWRKSTSADSFQLRGPRRLVVGGPCPQCPALSPFPEASGAVLMSHMEWPETSPQALTSFHISFSVSGPQSKPTFSSPSWPCWDLRQLAEAHRVARPPPPATPFPADTAMSVALQPRAASSLCGRLSLKPRADAAGAPSKLQSHLGASPVPVCRGTWQMATEIPPMEWLLGRATRCLSLGGTLWNWS